jgi:3'-5' exoribonuclease
MKSPYIAELLPNQMITATLLVQQKDVRQKKTGEPYLSLILVDRTGDIDAKMWDNATEVLGAFERDDYLRVRGLTQIHQNRLQLTIHKLQKLPAEQVDASDFFPASERNAEEMFAELRGIVDGFENGHLKAVVSSILDDPEIARRYKIAPAAKNVHHAFLGGLLEHVLSMCGLARSVGRHYRDIDMDLLLSGVVLHDIGKIYELTYDRSFGYSTEGQLIGHIVLSVRILGDKLALLPDFPPRLRTLLEHLILSHHGELEYGSPKQPMFPEALLLHHIDNIDSKMECMRAFTAKDRSVEGCWTGYNSTLERSLLKKQRYLDGTVPVAAVAPVQLDLACSTPAVVSPSVNPTVVSPGPQQPPPVRHAPAPPKTSTTVMAEKLMGALRGQN